MPVDRADARGRWSLQSPMTSAPWEANYELGSADRCLSCHGCQRGDAGTHHVSRDELYFRAEVQGGQAEAVTGLEQVPRRVKRARYRHDRGDLPGAIVKPKSGSGDLELGTDPNGIRSVSLGSVSAVAE